MNRLVSVALAGLLAAVPLSGCASTGTPDVDDPSLAAASVSSDREGVVLIDVRGPDAYAAGHLAGAVNLDFADRGMFSAVVKSLGKGSTYQVYGATAAQSEEAASWLAAQGLAVQDLGSVEAARQETGLASEAAR